MAKSMAWGYVRIIVGTLTGGALGFYVMNRLENSYQEKWHQQLKNYEQELIRKKERKGFNSVSTWESRRGGGQRVKFVVGMLALWSIECLAAGVVVKLRALLL